MEKEARARFSLSVMSARSLIGIRYSGRAVTMTTRFRSFSS